MNTRIARTTILPLAFCLFGIASADSQGLYTTEITTFNAVSRNGNVGLTWRTQSEENLMQYEIESSQDGRNYRNLGFIPARNNSGGNIYEFVNPVSYSDSAFYRLKIVDNGGRYEYTQPVLYYVNKITAQFVYPSVITNSVINIFINDPFDALQVVSLNGNVMLRQNLSGKTGRINVPLSPTLSTGMYVVQLSNKQRTITQKVIIQ